MSRAQIGATCDMRNVRIVYYKKNHDDTLLEYNISLLTTNDVWVGNQIKEGFLIVLSNPWMIQSMITGALELQDN